MEEQTKLFKEKREHYFAKGKRLEDKDKVWQNNVWEHYFAKDNSLKSKDKVLQNNVREGIETKQSLSLPHELELFKAFKSFPTEKLLNVAMTLAWNLYHLGVLWGKGTELEDTRQTLNALQLTIMEKREEMKKLQDLETGKYGDFSLPLVGDLLNTRFVIKGVRFGEGKFGEYAVIKVGTKEYRVHAEVLLKQLKKHQDIINSEGLEVELVKQKRYFIFR